MFTSSEQFITQMKFRELREQRDKALAAYDQLDRTAAEAPNSAARLRVLYTSLREMRFAKQPLHPNVANLDLILRELNQRWLPNETIAFWQAELERELERGRLRAEIVYTFGALLEEWATQNAAEAPANPAQVAARRELLAQAEKASTAHVDGAFLDELIASLHLADQEAVTELRKAITDALTIELTYMPDGSTNIEAHLKRISMEPYRSPAVRSQAQRFLLNPTLQKELHDALGILIDHLDEWRWPEPGVTAQAHLARNKWRLFLDEDLPTALLLEYLGERWRYVFDSIWRHQDTVRLERLKRLLELGAPDIIIQNERRMLARGHAIYAQPGVDIWASDNQPANALDADVPVDELVKRFGEHSSIYEQRAAMQSQLRRFDRFDSYSDADTMGGIDVAVNLIHAEIELGRAVFPDHPLYIVKVDLQDYYPSLPHELILALSSRLGLPDEQIEFFRRYLSVRINDAGRQVAVRQGIPIRRRLADTLGELVLRLLDAYVERSARVQVVRFMDDICLIAASADEAVRGWEAVQTFCRACGLAINGGKCGALCIGGDLPPELPTNPPRWMLLALDQAGQWRVDASAFEAYLEQTRQQVARATSIIARIQVYNAGAAYLEQALALTIPLGEAHRQSVSQAIARWHYAFFDENQGIVDALRGAMRERFTGAATAAALPEAWLYWPITAGGLGLRQVVMRTASYAEAFAQRQPPATPSDRAADWQRRVNDWSRFYGALLTAVKPIEPAANQVMETLVKDFISRGTSLSSGKQKTLSAYWRWVLYVYGPQILESFGTFRFLLSELVPLQLLTERYLEDPEASEAGISTLDRMSGAGDMQAGDIPL